MSKSDKYAIAQRMEDGIIENIDLKVELEPFLEQIDKAIAEAKTGKLKSLRSIATIIETVRILVAFRDAVENNNIKKVEYYGKLIRDHMMDRPKVALEHSAGEGMKGVVILPEATEGE